jgi:anti-sigma regulatory factor (Ser/Thr protein kinase)
MLTTTHAVVTSGERKLLADRHAPALARSYARRRLEVWGLDHFISVAELIVSELTTNAVTHARGDAVVVWLSYSGESVRVSVWDEDDEHLPEITQAADCDESGRGLVLVDVMADYWGTYRTDKGKVVFGVISK